MDTMLKPVLLQPIEWPVSVATPLEHIYVLSFLDEDEHISLSEAGLSIRDLALACGLRIDRLTHYFDSDWARDVRSSLLFLASVGWDTTSSNVINPLCSAGLLQDLAWEPEHAKKLLAANPSETWMEVAVEMRLPLADMAECAASELPVEYIRALNDA